MILTVQLVEMFHTGDLIVAGGKGIAVRLAAHFLAQHSGIVPGKIQLGIRGITAQSSHRLRTVFFIVDKNVTFFTFNQSQNIDFAVH